MRPLTLLRRGLQALCLALLPALAAGATYTFRSDSFAWESAANTISWDRSCTGYPGDDDKATINFSGGFKFSFGGSPYSSVRVLANGVLQFGTDTGFFRNFTNTTLPAGAATAQSGCTAAATTLVLMPYWTDLNPSASGSGGVTWEQKGSAPNRYLVVSWNNVYQYATTTPYTFQVILYENGEFKYQYGNANASGSNATIGVQVSGSDYTLYSFKSGYNANGSAIRWFIPSGTPARVAEYRLDEYTWSGTVGEVDDSSGNGHDGVGVGGATTTATAYVCRALDVPANTGTGSVAVDTSLSVPSSIGSTGSLSMWVRSNVAWTSSTPALLFDATLAAARPFYLMRNAGGALRFALTDSAGTTLVATTTAQTFGAGSWQHVAVTWRLANGNNQTTLRIYVNGALAATTPGTTNGTLDPGLGSLFLGDNRSSATPSGATANSANGQIDEVRLYNYEISAVELTLDRSITHSCLPPLDHVEVVPDSTGGSTCTPQAVTLKACTNSACTALLTSYTGTVNLSTGSGRGDWSAGSGPAPSGTLANGTANDGAASYTFAPGDGGSARLQLSHSLAQDVAVSAVDSSNPATARTSSPIAFRDNAFVFAEDAANRIAGSHVVVAGRPHDVSVTLVKKDPSSGSCGTASDYSGSRALKLWRSDSGGPWTAPSVVAPALSIPAAQPAANNLTLSFTSGVAGFNLGSSDIGRYTLNLLDDSLAYAAGTVSGSSATLTVRPFAIVVQGIAQGGTANPAGTLPGDAVFAKAGTNFQATVGAYRWSAAMTGNGTDANDDGLPDSGATLANTVAGGLAASFSSSVTLAPLAASQTPAGGVLGTLANGSVSGFSGGSATAATLQYSEVGSFALATSGVVGNFLGSGLALDATVFNAAGAQASRIGRFVPARFALSAGSVTHRVNAACAPGSAFTYLDEVFRLGFTLTAQSGSGATTQNYSGSYAKLALGTPASFDLAGVAGGTRFSAASARLALGTASGSWSNGVAGGITLNAAALRAGAPDGPFDAAFGIAPVDSDGVAIAGLDLDTDTSAGNDHAAVATVALRFGRLRLASAIGAADRPLALPLSVQSWTGTAFDTNTLDSCTRVPASAVSFGNLRRTLTAADTVVSGGTVALAAGSGQLLLAAPAGGHAGSADLAISLGSGASDASCLQPWTPASGVAASAGASLAFLRGAWCGGNHDKDPSARVSFGLYRGADTVVHQRENY